MSAQKNSGFKIFFHKKYCGIKIPESSEKEESKESKAISA